jgi:uncharacterized protein YlzI (FlbEa/FlbD family)
MNKITLHRPSGDEIQFLPRAIDVMEARQNGTFVVTKGGFKATVKESIDEINALIEQADKGVTK